MTPSSDFLRPDGETVPDIELDCTLADALAARLRDGREDLTRRWLDRIAARVALDPRSIFPTEDLLDHVPLLMDGIADYMADPADEISADAPVLAKAIELGELRYRQGMGTEAILKEYEILGGVLFSFLVRAVDDMDEPCSRSELLACAHRLFRAIAIIQQTTTTHYVHLAEDRVREREERLRGFNRMVSHELKNRIGAVLGAGELLHEDWAIDDEKQRARFLSIVVENAKGMQAMLEDLVSLSRTEDDLRQHRNILLPEAAHEVTRQLREMAAAAGVELRVADDLPLIEVNAAAVELCLVNYVSNGIKYADSRKPERWVEIRGWISGAEDAELVVAVRDNGLGIPEEARPRLFERFFRVDREGAEGTGLGLNIVQETVKGLRGRAWVEFEPAGSVFLIALPCRRDEDRLVAAGAAGSATD